MGLYLTKKAADFMEFKEAVEQGLRSILLHRLRTFLSTLGILFGVVAVIAMLAIGEGAKQEALEQIEQLGIRNIIIRQNNLSQDQQAKAIQQGSSLLSLDDMLSLEKALPDLSNIAALKSIKASLSANLQEVTPEILGVTRGYEEIQGLEMSEGRFISHLDISLRRQVCVLGSEIAFLLGKSGHIDQSIRIGNAQFQVVGILDHKTWRQGKSSAFSSRNLNQTLFLPLGTEAVFSRSDTKKNATLSEIVMQVVRGEQIPETVAMTKRIMEKRHRMVEDYQIIVPQELMDQAKRMQYTFNLVLGSVAAISLLVGGIGIMNIMLASVSERIREIGIRRAVGANRWHIARQFLLESLLITLMGAFGGVALGVMFSFLISVFAGWQTIVTPWSVSISLSMAIGVGLCSGFYPAWKAASLNPIAALRNE